LNRCHWSLSASLIRVGRKSIKTFEDRAMPVQLTPENTLPADGLTGTLIGRAWVPGSVSGPSPVVLRSDGVFDLSARFATLSELLESESPLKAVRETQGTLIASVEELLANSTANPDTRKPFLLAPADLQVIKAAGVTFAASMIERVIEEQAGRRRGQSRKPCGPSCTTVIGDNLRSHQVPGSEQAMQTQGAADRARHVVAIPGSRHWPGCGNLHQGSGARCGRQW
jgi:fumarylacetoacetate (FAA) hydrolase family protein